MSADANKVQIKAADTATVQAAREVLEGRPRGPIARLLPFLGPAFIASVAYMDPGNFATNIQGGAKFGYMLLWVVVTSNLMAMLLQLLSAKLGIATGQNLAELCRSHLPRSLVWFLWVLMEIMVMATDVAEFVGAAVGFELLLSVPLWAGGLLTAVFTFLILGLERYGFRPLEIAISCLVGLVAVCYLLETILDRPDWGRVFHHAVTPQFSGAESVLLAAGILGATVMPHALFLHSSLTGGRIRVSDSRQLRRLLRFQLVDVGVAMSIAGMINAAMLIMAAATFHRAGLTDLGSIEEAHRTLTPLLGPAASVVFALSLLAAGLSSSAVGTMAGQVIMQGFIHRRIPLWLRRGITILPSLVVIIGGFDPTRTLVLSQVILSFALPFAIIPLVLFTSRSDIMGVLVNRRVTVVVASIIALLVVALNLFLIVQVFMEG
jgi:manganese transport protein